MASALAQAIAELEKSVKEIPRGKAPASMGGNPEAKAAVKAPDEQVDGDEESETPDEGAIRRAAKKGKLSNQFEDNQGDVAAEQQQPSPARQQPAKKSMAAKLREVASRLHKGAFDDADQTAPSDESDVAPADDMGDGQPQGDDDSELYAAMQTIKSHPRIVKALAQALAEVMAGLPEGQGQSAAPSDDGYAQDADESDDNYGDDADESDDDETMSRAINYTQVLAKAMAEFDSTRSLKDAIAGEPVVAAFAEYQIAFGGELLARGDEQATLQKAQSAEIAALSKSLAALSKTVNGIGEVLLATHSAQEELGKSVAAVANTPRLPSPGVQVVRANGEPLRGQQQETVDRDLLFKALEDAANEGDEAAADLMPLVTVNPAAAYRNLSDPARKQYDALLASRAK